MTGPTSNPIDWSAAEIARRIQRREIAPSEVTAAFIARIEQVNPRLNAVVVPRFDEAKAEAAAADERLSAAKNADELPPLFGLPITIKECFYLAGTPSTIGLTQPAFRAPAREDGVLVRRLREAGAIVLGKTNLPQLMIWHESDNPVYGRTNNPWDLNRTCGGSSGGEAAIIAARGSPLGLANDLGGSIRIPCHFCGIHGLRPTSHRFSRDGARRTLSGFEAIVTQPGPMARHVEDLWLALKVLAGGNGGGQIPVAWRDPGEVAIDKLRILAWTDDGEFPASPAVQRAVRQAIEMLRSAGATVVEVDRQGIAEIFHPSDAFDLYCNLVSADGGAGARRLAHRSKLDPRVTRLMWIARLSAPVRRALAAALRKAGQHWQARIVQNARSRTTDEYWQLVERKNVLVAGIQSRLAAQQIDALLCPPYALPAPPHVRTFDLLAAASYSLVINLLGLPSGTVSLTRVRADEQNSRPSSRDKVLSAAALADQGSAGLPIGVQVSSLAWREDVVLAVMRELEQRAIRSGDLPMTCEI